MPKRPWYRDFAGIGCAVTVAACGGGGAPSEPSAAGGSGAVGQSGDGSGGAASAGGSTSAGGSPLGMGGTNSGGPLAAIGGSAPDGGGGTPSGPSSGAGGAAPGGAPPGSSSGFGGDAVGGAVSGLGGDAAGGSAPGGGAGIGGGAGGSAGAGGAPGSGGGTSGSGGGGGTSGSGGGAGSSAGGAGPDPVALFDVYWSFESQTNGAVSDLTGGGVSLRLEGAALDAGLSGQSLRVSGVESSAVTAGPPVNTSGSFSVSVWVRLDELGDFDTVVAQDGNQVSAFYLQKRSDGRLSLTTFPEDSTSSTACVVTGQIEPRRGEWYHVVGTRDATSREQRLYVDGLLSGRMICPSAVFSAQGGLSVGRGKYGAAAADWMTGSVDELGISASVLAPEQVYELYRAGRAGARHYLFAYFVEVGQGRGDGLRLAHSHDGQHWGAIGAGKVFLPPSVGGGSFRDPHLMLDPSGLYHLVWTTSCVPWAESGCVQDRGFGHASSRNLVDWSSADYLEIALNVEHVWAPETIYDEDSAQYMVYWSSPLDANPSVSDPHSIYYLLTSDFRTHSAPELLYSRPGRNLIDATIRRHGDGYVMIIKDEAEGQKNLRAVTSPLLYGPGAWESEPSAPLTGEYAAEGPALLERDGELYLYFDKYAEGAYGALRATAAARLDEPGSWQDVSDSVFFPGVRHGTPIEVTWDVLRDVALHAGD